VDHTIAGRDGGVPFVLPTAANYPLAPWMVSSSGGSFLTFAITALLWETRWREPWLERATDWCWAKLDGADELGAYGVKFALEFLNRVPDAPRAAGAVGRAGARSRALFTYAQIEAGLDALQDGQHDDGGWMFDWLGWSPGQSVEWRGIVTLQAVATLRAHGRGG
jgi:hypothetical protein